MRVRARTPKHRNKLVLAVLVCRCMSGVSVQWQTNKGIVWLARAPAEQHQWGDTYGCDTYVTLKCVCCFLRAVVAFVTTFSSTFIYAYSTDRPKKKYF